MFSPELLGETVIVGLLLVLGICMPFLLHPSPKRVTQIFTRLDSLSSTGVAAVLLLVLVYSIGLVGSLMANDLSGEAVMYICGEQTFGNRVVNRLGEQTDVCGNLFEPDDKLKQWITLYNDRLRQLKSECDTAKKFESCNMYNGWLSEGQARGDFVKIAETALKERDEPTRTRLDREKAYVRISQGAALAFLLLIISTTLTLILRYIKPYLWPAGPVENAEHAVETEVVQTETTKTATLKIVKTKSLKTEALKPDELEAKDVKTDEPQARKRMSWVREPATALIILLYVIGVVGVTFCFKEYLDTETKYEELVVHLYGGLVPK